MAIFHYAVDRVTRSSGRSAVGAAAYREGEKLHNEHDGITHDYTKRRGAIGSAAYHSGSKLNDGNMTHNFTKKGDVVYNEIMLPKHALREFMDSETLWNAVEKSEKRHDAQTARIIIVALPIEMNTEQHKKLLREHIKENFVGEGMCAGFSIHSGHIHSKKDVVYPFQDLAIQKDNPHAHIQLTVRPLNPDGSWGNKTQKEYILNENGERIRLKSGKGWRSRNIPLTDWEKPETLAKWRKNWAKTVNKEFERLGMDERISHLSLKEQGINREPTKHMGHEAWNLEKKGIKTKAGDENRAIMARNKALERLEEETRKHEPSTHGKLASIRNKQGLNHEPTAHITPETTAKYIHELKERYVLVDKKITELKNTTDKAKREINSLIVKAEEITERVGQINAMAGKLDELVTERQEMGFFKSKNAIDQQIQRLEQSYTQADSYFKRRYNITPDQAAAKVESLECDAESKKHLYEKLQEKIVPLIEEKEAFALEYNRQKLLLEVCTDKQEIQDRLKQFDKETRSQTPKDRLARAQIERALNIVSKRNFQEILKELPPEKAEILIRQREYEQEQELIRGIGRGR